MGHIDFTQDEAPFELLLQREPTASAEGRTVVVTLPVFVAGLPQETAEVKIPLSIQHAEFLYRQLEPALSLARARAKLGM
jgi:hypothetical protein